MALFNFATVGKGSFEGARTLLREHDMDSFAALPFRERVELAGTLTAVSGLYPFSAYRYHALRLLFYLMCISLAVLAPAMGCHSQLDLSTRIRRILPSAFVRLTALSALLEICGFCGMTGPLGAGQPTLAPLWYRITSGTLKQPLLHWLPRRRTRFDVVLFLLYVVSNLSVILSIPDLVECPSTVRLAVLLLSILCILDRTAYNGSLGAYYYALLVCEAFGGSAGILGCQLVQAAHLFMAGVGKLGPWFRHVTPSMVGFCPWVPRKLKLLLFAREAEENVGLLQPSVLSDFLTCTGIVLELVCPILMVSTVDVLRYAGVGLAVALHVYVIYMFAPGSVGEWNAFNCIAILYLFGMQGGINLSQIHSAPVAMLIFVMGAVYICPLIGNWKPDWLSNPFVLRKYTGNHPYHTFLLQRKAAPKLNCFRTHAPLVAARPPPQAELVACGAFHSLVRGRLNLRRVLDLFELAANAGGSDVDAYVRVDLGFLFSQTMLDVTFLDHVLLDMLKNAGFLPGELYSLRVSSFPTFTRCPHRAPWQLYDVGAGEEVAVGLVASDETFMITPRAA